jgi:hypothetical protein
VKLLQPHGEAIQAGRRLLRMLGYSVRVQSQPQRRVVAVQYLGKLIGECIGVGLGFWWHTVKVQPLLNHRPVSFPLDT